MVNTSKKEADMSQHEEEIKRRMIEALRARSREKYLKTRQEKIVAQLRDSLLDEKFLFEGEKLSKREEQEIAYKRKVYEIAVKMNTKDSDNYYQIPEDERAKVALERDKALQVTFRL
ncbi:hypothetical protein SELMODRAFT_424899 [Selaginella moellendorffii]|uniref:Uncharacterized protein n=1 Tax=Selaginella moellendorffii TaxID=88036 RepID=D8SRD0_SELML|nr:hypothetical protein SELMODRAFT_424899 [Selaginella moellendorffii]